MNVTLRTKAIVLRRTNYGEADRIIQVLTPDHAKLSGMARGARKSGSKLAGGLELLSVSDMTLHKGKGDLYTITSARLDVFYGEILKDYDRLQAAYRYIKDVSRASEIVGEPEWYQVLQTSLASLNVPRIPLQLIDIWYRLQVAQLLGQGLNAATTSDGKALDSDERYEFDVETMSFYMRENGRYGADEIKLLRVAAINPPAVLAKITVPNGMLDDLMMVARSLAEI